MRPGMRVRPFTSITRASFARIAFADPSRIVSPSTRTLMPSGQSPAWPSKSRALGKSSIGVEPLRDWDGTTVSYRVMKDLTQGPIPKHVVALALPMMAGMLLQTLYFFVDLYFVSRLGDAAIAGVSAAGNLMFVTFFLSQMLGVGTVAMVSHAVGRKDQAEANHVFNQATVIALACTL